MPSTEPPSAHGWIDLHCHLLPGIDDGCRTNVESIECVRSLISAGYRGSVCTPHFILNVYPANTIAAIRAAVDRLSEALAAAGIQYSLWAGAEVRLDVETIGWFETAGVPALADGRCVLIDYFGADWPDFADDAIIWLKTHGYQPILAHPERMGIRDPALATLLDRLTAAGVWLQGNFNSLAGNEGPAAERTSRALLQKNRYTVLALDLHRPDGWPSRHEGIVRAVEIVGRERLEKLLSDRPRAIVRGSDLPI